ncbi:MAG: methyl-accepting chemotaxis protein [Sulfuricella sp.]
MKIAHKIALLAIVPMLGMTWFAGTHVYHSWNEWRHMRIMSEQITLLIDAGPMAHDLQRERGATVSFVSSQGKLFASALPGWRSKTEASIEKIHKTYAAMMPEAKSSAISGGVENADAALQKLPDTRKSADAFSIGAPLVAEYFTGTIKTVLGIIPSVVSQSINDAGMSRLAGSYMSFLAMKEQAGQERALMTAVFFADSIEAEQHDKWVGQIAAQKELQAEFARWAPENILSALVSKQDGAPFNEVAKARTLGLLKTSGFGINAEKWFAASSARSDALHEIENMLAQGLLDMATANTTAARNSLMTSALIGTGMLLFVLIVGYVVATGITRRLSGLGRSIGTISENRDLSIRLDASTGDEIGVLSEDINRFLSEIGSSMKQIGAMAEESFTSADGIAGTAKELSGTAGGQSEAASAMASAVEEMTVSIAHISETTKGMRLSAKSGMETVIEGGEVILRVVSDMQSIASAVKTSSNIVAELGEHSNQISSIVQSIREIADQTNLLALNAAIEAARAGEQGRGFAVVADEVRKLAERTSSSTADIARMIGAIQGGTSRAVESIADGVSRVNEGVRLAGQAGDAIGNNRLFVDQVGVSITDISAAMEEQSAASNEIASHVEQVSQMTEETHAAASRMSGSASEMAMLANSVKTETGKFRT